MAEIREQLVLENRFSETLTQFIRLAEQCSGSAKEMNTAARSAGAQARVLSSAYQVAAASSAAAAAEQRRLTAEHRANASASNAAVAAARAQTAQSRAATAALQQEAAAQNAAAAAARAQLMQTRAATAAERLAEQQAKKTANATKTLASSQTEAAATADNLSGKLRGLLGTYLSFQTVKGVFNLSDELASTNARLKMMTGSAEAAAAAQNEIFAAAMRSRGAYTDMADTVAKLGTLAGSAFGSTSEIIAFAEQLQKQMALSGTSSASAQAAILQLTQGLSSGVLRGEELNSVLEQTPMIAQTIADSLGVTTGKMREMASEGALTADVVKNAILGAADETNAAFEKMPYTWAQVWTQIKNITLRMTQPVLNVINRMANKIDDAMQWIKDNSELVAGALAAVATAAAIAGAQMVLSALKSAGAWAAAHPVLMAVVAAVGLIIYTARAAGAAWEEIGGVIGGVFGYLYTSAMNVLIVPVQNAFATLINFLGNLFNDWSGSIVALFADLATNVVGKVRWIAQAIESLINAIPGVEINITSGLDRLYNNMRSGVDEFRRMNGMKTYVTPWDYVNLSEAVSGGVSIGSRLGRGLDNFDLNSFVSGLTGSSYIPTASIPQLDDIAGSVASIEKAVDMSQEDLKMLVDESERRYVNRINLTSQTPVITVNGANTGRTAADRQSLANAIRDILIEQTAAGSVISTAAPVVG